MVFSLRPPRRSHRAFLRNQEAFRLEKVCNVLADR